MPTGDNPNSRKNLKPFNTLTKKELREITQKGTAAANKKIKERKTLRETLLLLLDNNRAQEHITTALIQKAIIGDVKAFEVIRDTIGEKPTDKIDNSGDIVIKWQEKEEKK